MGDMKETFLGHPHRSLRPEESAIGGSPPESPTSHSRWKPLLCLVSLLLQRQVYLWSCDPWALGLWIESGGSSVTERECDREGGRE